MRSCHHNGNAYSINIENEWMARATILLRFQLNSSSVIATTIAMKLYLWPKSPNRFLEEHLVLVLLSLLLLLLWCGWNIVNRKKSRLRFFNLQVSDLSNLCMCLVPGRSKGIVITYKKSRWRCRFSAFFGKPKCQRIVGHPVPERSKTKWREIILFGL